MLQPHYFMLAKYHTTSRIAATPIPPAVQMEINPRPLPFSKSILASEPTILAPVAAKG